MKAAADRKHESHSTTGRRIPLNSWVTHQSMGLAYCWSERPYTRCACNGNTRIDQ